MVYTVSGAANSGLVLIALVSLFYLVAQQAPTSAHAFKRSLEVRQADSLKVVVLPVKYNYVVLGQLDGNLYTSVQFGKDNQNLTMALSYDQITWVPKLPESRTDFCNNRTNEAACRIGGSLSGYYDPGTSKSIGKFHYDVPGISVANLNLSADGYYVEDKVTAGGVTLDLQFGVANNWNIPPTLGLGIWPLVVTKKPSYLEGLEQQGKITAQFVSCYDLTNDRTGSIILGGIDLNKFSGKLAVFDRFPLPGIVDTPSIAIINGDETPKVFNYTDIAPAAISPLTQFIYIPKDVLDALTAALPGVAYDDKFEVHTLPCDAQLDRDSFFEVTLAGFAIKLPFQNLITPIKVPNAANRCFIATQNIAGTYAYGYDFSYIFGGPFLSSAYVVVNPTENVTAIGIANPNVTSSNIIELGGPFGTPLADLVGKSPEPQSSDDDDEGGSNVGAIAGGVVGGVVAIAGIVAGIWFFRRRRQQPSPAPVPDHGSSVDDRDHPPELGGGGIARPKSELDGWAAYNKQDGKDNAPQYAELSNMQPRYQDHPVQELPSPMAAAGQGPQNMYGPGRQPTYELAG